MPNNTLTARCTLCTKLHTVPAPRGTAWETISCCGKSSPIWKNTSGEIMFDGYITPVVAEAAKPKTATVRVRFQGFDWRNSLTVQSPTGRVVTLHCNGKWKAMSQELAAFVHSYHRAASGDYRWGHWADAEMSYALMSEVKALAAA